MVFLSNTYSRMARFHSDDMWRNHPTCYTTENCDGTPYISRIATYYSGISYSYITEHIMRIRERVIRFMSNYILAGVVNIYLCPLYVVRTWMCGGSFGSPNYQVSECPLDGSKYTNMSHFLTLINRCTIKNQLNEYFLNRNGNWRGLHSIQYLSIF